MIEQFEAVSYKGLQNFCVGPLERVNLITGPNGVGKTSLAEALWLFHGRDNPTLLWNLHVQRKPLSRPSPLEGLGGPVELRGREDGAMHGVRFEFDEVMQPSQRPTIGIPRHGGMGIQVAFGPGFATPLSAELEGLGVQPSLGRLKATYDLEGVSTPYESDVVLGPAGAALATRPPQLGRASAIIVIRDSAFSVGPDTIERFSDAVAQGQKQRLLQVLRLMQPRIRSVEILADQGVPCLWVDAERAGMLPLEAAGGGVVRLFTLLANFFAARGGLILIDEIENGIHYSALPELWKHIRDLSEELDVQVVATTHSFECIQAAVMTEDGNTSPPPDFVLLRMYQKEGVPHCLTYAGEKLMAALDMGFEIR